MEMAMSDVRRESKRARHAGTRSCVGCLERVPREAIARELVHLVLVPPVSDDASTTVVVDTLGRSTGVGRGAWIHARRDCLEKAVKKGLARSAKGRVSADEVAIAAQIVTQAERRVEGLLQSARRAGALAFGGTPVTEAVSAGNAAMVLVATDAASAAKLAAVRTAQREGLAVGWGDKSRLGAIAGRSEVGVTAILDPGIADALRHALGLIETFSGGFSRPGR
jgi:predicted RNA-binding protein YlxR (DUF448 family)